MIMKHSIFLIITVWVSALFVSCSEERLAEHVASPDFEEGELVLVPLGLSVNSFEVGVQTSGSRAPEEEELAGSAEENAIHNLWVFQFDDSGDQLINPRYYTITDQSELENLEVKVWLKPGVSSTVYVVTNTGQPNWITEQTDVSTIEKLQSLELYNLEPQFINEGQLLSIPMQGCIRNVTVNEEQEIIVPVERMFAKLRVKVYITPDNMSLRSIGINRMPKACKVIARTGDGEDKTNYSATLDWASTAFDSEDTEEYIVYMAENMQGAVEDVAENNSANACNLMVMVERRDPTTGAVTYPDYVVYPGTDPDKDNNIKRNCIYDITINIDHGDGEEHIPSSNCFVVVPGNLMSFEPYYRVEKGGGYDFKEYLNADDPTGEKVIDHVKILWQTKGAIGDNTQEARVWYDSETEKIYVRAGEKGNALIAAYNKKGTILWSWHIWVTGHDPANISKAIRYNTYRWDSEGIHTNEPRTSGLEVMPCNLGALANEPEYAQDTKPFGMLYQWGRKDPFPPFIQGRQNNGDYNLHTGDHYDNSNNTLVTKTSDYNEDMLFYSLPGSVMVNLDNPILYAIQHPTVFMCGTKEVKQGETYVETLTNYVAEGDWTDRHDDKLWGGLPPIDDGTMEKYTIKDGVHIYDNYGPSKTIFDPCPYGWRVAPGELWLGFTSTGLNPESWEQVNNYNYPGWSTGWWGTFIYMQSWKGENGDGYTYFPNQGTRVGDGYGMRVGQCGNYHNATTDQNNRVNILHIHNNAGLFHIFETTYLMYYVKSVAGPIRCVRDPNPGQ